MMTENLCFSTLGCPDWSFRQILDCAAENGVSGLEIRGIGNVMDAEKIPEFMPENVAQTKRALREKGLKIVGFGTSCNFHDSAHVEDAIRQGKTAIDVCSRMNIPFIRVFGDRVTDEASIQAVAKSIGKLCRYGKEKGVSVLQEIHGDFNRLEHILPVIRENMSHENFGILWDIEHSDKVYGDDWQVFYREIQPFIRHVHIKDYIRATASAPFRLTLVGEGEIPITAIVRQLEKNGYQGYYSLEWEKKWVPELPEFPVAMESFLRTMEEISEGGKHHGGA